METILSAYKHPPKVGPTPAANGDAPAVSGKPRVLGCGWPQLDTAWCLFKASNVEGLRGRIGAGVPVCSIFIELLCRIGDQPLAIAASYPVPG